MDGQIVGSGAQLSESRRGLLASLSADPTRTGDRELKISSEQVLRFGADDGIRTRDPHLGKVMLYQLSHVRVGLPE
jgi:hypothetical protein